MHPLVDFFLFLSQGLLLLHFILSFFKCPWYFLFCQ
nr:MAG TPA: hypothetical protein [Caudoviricetes sp.]